MWLVWTFSATVTTTASLPIVHCLRLTLERDGSDEPEFASLRLIWISRLHQRTPWCFTLDFRERSEEEIVRCLSILASTIQPPCARLYNAKRLLKPVSHHPDKTPANLLAMSCLNRVIFAESMPTIAFLGCLMLRLSSYLDRCERSWRKLRALGNKIVGIVRMPARILWRPGTIALQWESFEDYCARISPERVESGEALLAEPVLAPRIWTCVAPAPLIDYSRIITIDSARQPSFASAPPTYPSTRQAYLRLRSAIVYPRPGLVSAEMGVVLNNNLLKWVPEHRLMPGFVDFVDDKLVARDRELRPGGHVRRTVLLLCHAFHRNYGHWLFDCLPYLLPWRGPILQGSLAVLVPPLLDWQRRTLELLGVPASAVIEASEPSVLCDSVIVPGLNSMDFEPMSKRKSSRLPQPGSTVVEAIQILRAGICPTAAIDLPSRIYVSRRGIDSLFRTLCNEDEVEAVMIRLGFAVVRPQDLSFDEQVATFARARIIAGPHGAGLTNAAFAPRGCLVIDICADSWATAWMVRLTQLFGHNYLPVAFPADAELSQPIFLGEATIGQSHFYTVQTKTLISIIESEMQRLSIE